MDDTIDPVKFFRGQGVDEPSHIKSSGWSSELVSFPPAE
jgi:hypothetical protein